MTKLNHILNYCKIGINKCQDATTYINKHSDFIEDYIGTTHDIVSNGFIGRDLIRFATQSPTIAQGFENNYISTIDDLMVNHFDKLDIAQNLTPQEREILLKNVDDKGSFIACMLGYKPSTIIDGKHNFLKQSDKFDYITRTVNVPVNDKIVAFDTTMILNKEKTKDTIAENLDFYVKRMNMKVNSSVDDVYNELTGKNSPLKSNDAHDIIGITLGYSPINSIIFQLEKNMQGSYNSRNDIPNFKNKLLNTLMSDNSPYNNFDNKFKSDIATAIRNIAQNDKLFETPYSKFGFCYVNFVPDSLYEQKVIKSVTNTFHSAKSIINS